MNWDDAISHCICISISLSETGAHNAEDVCLCSMSGLETPLPRANHSAGG